MISMLTPVRNGRQTIEDTVKSVVLQGEYCSEHIVLDANSDDGTSEYLSSIKDGKLRHIRERDAGLYDAMNKGVALARSEVIGIINADDYLLPGALSAVHESFRDTSVDFVYGDVETVEEDGSSKGLFPVRDDWVAGAKHWYGRDWRFIVPFNHPGLFVRRSTYMRLGAYDLSYRLAADHEFMCRLIAGGAKGKRINRTLACFRLGGASSDGIDLFAEDERIAVQYGVHPAIARLNRWRSSGGRLARRVLAGNLKFGR